MVNESPLWLKGYSNNSNVVWHSIGPLP